MARPAFCCCTRCGRAGRGSPQWRGWGSSPCRRPAARREAGPGGGQGARRKAAVGGRARMARGGACRDSLPGPGQAEKGRGLFLQAFKAGSCVAKTYKSALSDSLRPDSYTGPGSRIGRGRVPPCGGGARRAGGAAGGEGGAAPGGGVPWPPATDARGPAGRPPPRARRRPGRLPPFMGGQRESGEGRRPPRSVVPAKLRCGGWVRRRR